MGASGVRPVGFFTRRITSFRVKWQFACLALRPARYNTRGPADIGLEMEIQLVDTQGQPAHGLAQVLLDELAAMGEARIVAEIGDWILELNLSVRMLIGTPLSDMFTEAESLLALIRKLARRHDARVIAIGILPTARECDIRPSHMAPADRYGIIDRALWRREKVRRLAFHRVDGEPMRMDIASVMAEVICTSVQPHFYFPGIERVADMHNIIMATSGVLEALYANGPLPFGGNGWKDARSHLFANATADRCHVGGYINGPFDTIREASRSRPLVQVAERLFSRKALNLLIQIGTQWKMIDRIIPLVRKRKLRHEVRYCSALPLKDVMSFMAILGGILANPRSEHLARLIPEYVAKANFDQACRDGTQPGYLWPAPDGGVRSTPMAKIIRDLLALARDGWALLDVELAEVERFLQPIEARLLDNTIATTGADWQIARTRYYLEEGLGYWDAVAHMVADYAELCSHDDLSIAEWPDPGVTTAQLWLTAAGAA